jgi:hypothetical protein
MAHEAEQQLIRQPRQRHRLAAAAQANRACIEDQVPESVLLGLSRFARNEALLERIREDEE